MSGRVHTVALSAARCLWPNAVTDVPRARPRVLHNTTAARIRHVGLYIYIYLIFIITLSWCLNRERSEKEKEENVTKKRKL